MMRPAGMLVALVALAACAPATAQPSARQPGAVQPVQRAVAQPLRPPPPTAAGPMQWLDAPLSAGAWSYRGAGSGGSAAFFGPRGAPAFAIRCEPGRRVSLTRSAAGAGVITFRTSSMARAATAVRAGGSASGSVATVAASDPLLDALAFSRGRFSVETAGVARLILPAWPELARVVEDCRR
jgi:hypothetical protein